MTMQDGTLRSALFSQTRDLHTRLDRQIGIPGDAAAYGAFLSGSHAFRTAVEPQLAAVGGWRMRPLAGLIASDLADLGLPVPPAPDAVALTTPAARAAACYVLEGSALGGRLIARRATALGFGADHGARHLAAQTQGRGRWRDFLAWLEAGDFCVSQAAAAARAVFVVALRAHGAKAAA